LVWPIPAVDEVLKLLHPSVLNWFGQVTTLADKLVLYK
jgi:hypothetical protein